MKGYYFSTHDRKLRYGDNRPISVGVTHSVEGKLVPCENGLHFSLKLIDALPYAPGPILWRVESGEEVLVGNDKCCARERTYLAEFDATAVLQAFARRVALDVHHLAAPHYKSQEEADMVKRYLETGDEGLREGVRSAAHAVWYTAWYVEIPSAYEVGSAAYVAWHSAEEGRGVGSARVVAKEKYARWLEEMVMEATGWEETA